MSDPRDTAPQPPGPRIVCTGCQSPQAVFRREIGTFLCDECWDSLAMLGVVQKDGSL